MSERFAGARVVVTGGGRGIGRQVALGFAAEGADVAIIARTTSQLGAVHAELAETGGKHLAVTCDVADEAQVADAQRCVADAFGTADVLVNAAGVFTMGASADYAPAEARALLATNVLGTLQCCQSFGRPMLARGRGKIVNFASLLSFTAFPERAAYAASKAGVTQLTRVLGVEWAAAGVNVNAVAPGMIRIETPHPAALAEDDIIRRIPAGRRGRPQDVTGAVRFLASPDADYINGQTIVVDGGWLSYGYL
ncbi:SDR family NAD(P)-dependent oxidoreductase [Streptomyces zagrosensis]|uniref:NAD(P)-dependent dehydrogenase (Short-subunit alcohol dehydrogenase family) n=1 Tax=Streptomyces zagrosensis TaxID=1042984 RepID=A0A7W9QEX4_9ACTN|nr:SDR family oxidoreductase [Streptomyces zagrosensis]MBB5938990.1 NAD(P)-dependent dehydrogenase (short-subunit alcohol dehydrogenase family) [Streptomyces zagrosensis]